MFIRNGTQLCARTNAQELTATSFNSFFSLFVIWADRVERNQFPDETSGCCGPGRRMRVALTIR